MWGHTQVNRLPWSKALRRNLFGAALLGAPLAAMIVSARFAWGDFFAFFTFFLPVLLVTAFVLTWCLRRVPRSTKDWMIRGCAGGLGSILAPAVNFLLFQVWGWIIGWAPLIDFVTLSLFIAGGVSGLFASVPEVRAARVS